MAYCWAEILFKIFKVSKSEDEDKKTESAGLKDEEIPVPVMIETSAVADTTNEVALDAAPSTKDEPITTSALLVEFEADMKSSESKSTEEDRSKKLLTRYKYKIVFVAIAAYYVLFKMQSLFFYGVLFGALWTSMLSYVIFKLNERKYIEPSSVILPPSSTVLRHVNDEAVDGVHKVWMSLVSSWLNVKPSQKLAPIVKAWMNELHEKYNPSTYFLNKTQSVYISLDLKSSILRLQMSKIHKIPKRSVSNESVTIPPFDEQRIYDIKGK